MPLQKEFNAKAARAKRPCPIWVDRFQTDTQHLSADEVGAYFLLLMAMWSRETCDFPDNDERLARVCRVSLRLWKSRIGAAIRLFLTTDGEVVFQKRLRKEAAFVERAVKAQSDRKVGEKSAKPLKDNDVDQSADYSVDSPTDDQQSYPTQLPNNPTQKEEEGARAREADFLILVIEAVGIDPVDVPRFWTGPQAAEHLKRWKAMGLTEAEVVAEAKASRQKNPEPPDGPKALDRWMEQAVKAKVAASAPVPAVQKAQAQPKIPMPPKQRLQFFADLINGPGHVPTSMITNTIRDALLEAGLVTPEKLRERQIY